MSNKALAEFQLPGSLHSGYSGDAALGDLDSSIKFVVMDVDTGLSSAKDVSVSMSSTSYSSQRLIDQSAIQAMATYYNLPDGHIAVAIPVSYNEMEEVYTNSPINITISKGDNSTTFDLYLGHY